MIVVKKTSNGRFFAENNGQFFNPPAGTVINRDVLKNPE